MSEPNPEIKLIHETIDFGFQVEAFLLSPVGKYLVGRAEGEIDEAVQQLKVANPTDAALIRELQNKIYRAESVQFWLAEAIQEGTNAQRELHERDVDG